MPRIQNKRSGWERMPANWVMGELVQNNWSMRVRSGNAKPAARPVMRVLLGLKLVKLRGKSKVIPMWAHKDAGYRHLHRSPLWARETKIAPWKLAAQEELVRARQELEFVGAALARQVREAEEILARGMFQNQSRKKTKRHGAHWERAQERARIARLDRKSGEPHRHDEPTWIPFHRVARRWVLTNARHEESARENPWGGWTPGSAMEF